MSAPSDPFADLAALGYGSRLIPIIPPKAPISDRSSLFKRIAAGDDARGKAPGVRWPDGRWSGFDWRIHQTTPSDLGRWANMGAGVGVKCGDGLAVIDADTLNEDLAAVIKAKVEAIVGLLPVRIGRYPKAAYVVRVEGPYRHALLEFGHANGRPRERVEILGEGRQFVAAGIHPATGQPYRWPRGVPRLEDIPLTTPEALNALMEALRGVLPEAGPVSREGTGGDVDQALLRGRAETVRAALRALPNTYARFPTRESYLAVGYAIQAALSDEPETALSLFENWCAGYVGPLGETNEPEVVRGDWRRMKPPFRRGASWLYEMAHEASGGAFNATALDFNEDIIEHESIFPDEPPAPTPAAAAIRSTPFDLAAAMAVRPRESLYGGHYVRQFLSSTIAPSKVGKSSLIIAEALAMASGKPLLGVRPAGLLRVWMWNGEDPLEELQRRIWACMKHYGLQAEDIGDRLFVDSGRRMPIVLATQTRSGVSINEPVEAAVISTILENRIDVFQVDPFISSHRVSENDNNAIDAVTKRWGSCADVTRAAIEIPHHSRKLNGAEVSVEDGRGASALLATVRSSRALARMTSGEAEKLGLQDVARRLFRFTEVSSNLSIPAAEDQKWLELASVNLENGRGEDMLDRSVGGDSVGVVRVFDMPDRAAKVLAEMNAGPHDAREENALREIATGQWKADVQGGIAWAGHAVAASYGLDMSDASDKAKAKIMLSAWKKEGRIDEIMKTDGNGNRRKFLIVKKHIVTNEDLFG